MRSLSGPSNGNNLSLQAFILKLIIASIIILFGVVLCLFSLFPSRLTVSRVVLINASQSAVAGKIADLRTWKNWNELTREKTGGTAAEKNVGPSDSARLENETFSIHLVKQTADSVITRWQDAKGRSFTGKFTLTESGGQVILQWSLEFHLRWYPWEKMASMFYDKQLGPLMDQSLKNLRKSLEPARDKVSQAIFTRINDSLN
jgi:hypothetical protein